MRFWACSLLVLLLLACGEVNRAVGSLEPELGQAGAGSSTPADLGGPDDLSRPWLSSGCGLPPPTSPGQRAGYNAFFVNQTGETLDGRDPSKAGEREFFVRLPPDYDPSVPYRVVYVLQGCGALRAGDRSGYPLFDEELGGFEQAIYVALSVPDHTDLEGCYDHASGGASQEWEAFALVHEVVDQSYCVDNNRIYSVGFDSGATLSNMWGCYFAGIPSPPRKFAPRWALRGHVAVGGYRQVNIPMPCNGPSAGLWIHDTEDVVNTYDRSTAALYVSLVSNGCEATNEPRDELPYDFEPRTTWLPGDDIAGFEPGACQRYTGCDAQTLADHPLVFCSTEGRGHDPQTALAVRTITTFFDAVEGD